MSESVPTDDAESDSETATAESETEGESVDAAAERGEQELDRSNVLAQVDTLRAENERLRAAYRDAQRQRYRRTAVGFALVGLVSVLGAWLFPGVRTILLALGGTGLFAAVMTLYLTPESFVPASIGEALARTYSQNAEAIAADLGLSDRRVYLPGDGEVRLYLPQFEAYDTPTVEALSTPFVTTDNERSRGLSLVPAGNALYDSFEQVHSGPVPDRPTPLARALSDAAIEQFELVARADPETEPGRLAVGLSGVRISPISGLDHPLASFIAVGLASTLDTVVDVEVRTPDDDRYDSLLVYTWEPDDDSTAE